ncbi:MAG: class I SAM-dependent methyltransferase [Planctomycetaceae bacterium]|nr:class I SAM-dependent methyltransferase [Planctomycetales bacterium]MCB9921947.1 class I SAM-dependent methyltransferase [Planctomycetaceae bacterium]
MDSTSPAQPSIPEDRRNVRRIAPLLVGGTVVVLLALVATFVVYRRVDALPTTVPAEEFRIGLNAPFITTADAVVDKMVEVAELTPDDVVYDLGCGDGRLVITAALKHGCHGVGIDIDPERVAEAKANVKLHGVEDLVEIREQDVFTVDLREADVILMYLLPWMTKRLIPQFQEMAPGSRIISHDFGIGDIKYIEPDSTYKVPLEGSSGTHLVHRWDTPLDVPPPKQGE